MLLHKASDKTLIQNNKYNWLVCNEDLLIPHPTIVFTGDMTATLSDAYNTPYFDYCPDKNLLRKKVILIL